MTPREREEQARSRFLVLNLLRVSGVILMLFGMGVEVSGWGRLPQGAGALIFTIGLVDALIVPRLLARRWRTPPRP